jgi:hypothetical protein
VEAKSSDLLYDIQTLLLEELKSTIRKYSAGVELKLEPTEEETLHQDFLVEKNGDRKLWLVVMLICNVNENHI